MVSVGTASKSAETGPSKRSAQVSAQAVTGPSTRPELLGEEQGSDLNFHQILGCHSSEAVVPLLHWETSLRSFCPSRARFSKHRTKLWHGKDRTTRY